MARCEIHHRFKMVDSSVNWGRSELNSQPRRAIIGLLRLAVFRLALRLLCTNIDVDMGENKEGPSPFDLK